MDGFLVRAGFTPMSIIAPSTPKKYLLLVLVGFIGADEKLSSCTCMEFIITVICASCVMAAKLDLARTELAFCQSFQLVTLHLNSMDDSI